MKTLNYGQLKVEQKQQVNKLIADLEGKLPLDNKAVRFVAKGLPEPPSGGEF